MRFVHDDSQEFLTEYCVGEGPFWGWYLPGAGIFARLPSVRLSEVVE